MNFFEFFSILNIEAIDGLANEEIESFEMYTQFLKKNSVYFHWKVGNENLKLIDISLMKGAVAVTSDKSYINHSDKRIIYVPSIRKILEKIASIQRERFNGKLIAVTGSVGKSTVKNMLSHILSMTDITLSTKGNENSWLGIYCTLCNIKAQTKYIVLETGASGPKSLSLPIKIVRPDISVLLDVNYSHQDRYSSFQELLMEKASVIDELEENGHLIISTSTYELLKEQNYQFRSNIHMTTVSDQQNNSAHFSIDHIELDRTQSKVFIRSDILESVVLKQSNYANSINAVYSWIVCKRLGLKLAQFNSLIDFYKPLARRFERIRICDKNKKIFELIDDAYNASPISTLNLIESLEIRNAQHKILVLGDMLELGESSIELHQNVLNHPAMLQFDTVLLHGDILSQCSIPSKYIFYDNLDELNSALSQIIQLGDLIVLKASHGMNFYAIRKYLEKDAIQISYSLNWFIEDEFDPMEKDIG